MPPWGHQRGVRHVNPGGAVSDDELEVSPTGYPEIKAVSAVGTVCRDDVIAAGGYV